MCQAVLRWLQGAVASAECEEIAFAADVGRRVAPAVCQAVLRWLQGAVASAECEEIAFAADVGRRVAPAVCQAVLRWLQGAVASAECEEIVFAADVGRRMVLMVKSLDRMGRAAVPAGRLVVYLYGDAAEESPTATLCWGRGQAGMGAPRHR